MDTGFADFEYANLLDQWVGATAWAPYGRSDGVYAWSGVWYGPDGELSPEAAQELGLPLPPIEAGPSPEGGLLPGGGGANGGGGGGDGGGGLMTLLRTLLKNPNCAALLGGIDRGTQALNHFSGFVNVDSPGYSGPEDVKNAIDNNRAFASTLVPVGGNFTNGKWSGPNFSTYVGTAVANDSLSQQATVEWHELLHVMSRGNVFSAYVIDMKNPYGQTTNIYDIAKACGTALPQGF